MANTAEVKSRGFAGALDPNDPLMELSRIIGVNTHSHAPRPAVADPQLNIEDSFALDLERELSEDAAPEIDLALDDDFARELEGSVSTPLDLGTAVPPVEPSLEDELNALLMEVAPAAEYEQNFGGTAPQLESNFELEIDEVPEAEVAFDTADWLDEPLPLVEGHAAELSDHDELADPILSEMSRTLNAAPIAEAPIVEVGAVEDLAEPDFEFDEPELDEPEFVDSVVNPVSEPDQGHAVDFYSGSPTGYEVEPDYEPEIESPQRLVASQAVQEMVDLDIGDINLAGEAESEPDQFDDLPPAPEFAVQPEFSVRLPGSDAPLEQLLARTAPQPVIETVNAESNAVETVEEFEIPDFEFDASADPKINDDYDLDEAYDNNYKGFESTVAPTTYPAAKTAYPAATTASAPLADEGDIDFEGLLNEELGASVSNDGDDKYSAGYTTAAAVAVAGASAYRRSGFDHEETEPDLDSFQADMAEDRYDAPVAKNRSWLAATAIAGVLLIAGGWWAFSGDGSTTASGGPALVKADPQPVKIAPETPGGKTVANQDKAVYDKVAGADAELPSQGQLVSESEEPVDIASVAPADSPAGKSEERVDPALAANTSSEQAADTLAITPKKVKTFIVKPDGTLVERAAPVASTEAAAPAEPPASALVEPETLAKAPNEVAALPEAKALAPDVASPEAVAVAPVAEAPVEKPAAAIKVVKTKKIKAPAAETQAKAVPAEAAPVTERPSDQPVTIVGKTGGKTNAEPQAEQVAAADPAPQAVAGGYSIQIASTPSPEAAKSTYAALTRKFGAVISGRGVNIQKAEVDGKGTVYRVRIPAGSKQEATALCSQYKSAGGSCFVSK